MYFDFYSFFHIFIDVVEYFMIFPSCLFSTQILEFITQFVNYHYQNLLRCLAFRLICPIHGCSCI